MRTIVCASLLLNCVSVNASAWTPPQLMDFSAEVCQNWQKTGEFASGDLKGPVETSNIQLRGNPAGLKHRLLVDDKSYLEVDVVGRTGARIRFIATLFHDDDKPRLMLSLASDCSLRVARKINYSDDGQALNIVSLDDDFAASGEPEWLNPELEFVDSGGINKPGDSGGLPIRVALVDSGVNYTIPFINRQLARDADNNLVGYDFWDLDELPYDAHQTRSKFFVQRHGTRTASLLLREAPQVELVPYRYPRPDMSRMRELVEHAHNHGVSIVGMPLGSNRAQDWTAFEQAARAHPEILFIASAGNNGRDIDEIPVYPAALDLDNMLVVTSADDFVKPAARTNWGRKSVDFLVPAENITLLDYSANEIRASGSSYAVSRVVALAARLKQANRAWKAKDIIAELQKRYANQSVHNWVSSGYIADPLAHHPLQFKPLKGFTIGQDKTKTGLQLALDILVLDPAWTRQRIVHTLKSAYDLLGQCGISAGKISMHAFDGDDYLRDLSTGAAHTLLSDMDTSTARVIFARDTRMQDEFSGEAFGEGNTRRRPWLTNSVWLMLDIEDEGMALAHELYHVISNSGHHVETPGNLMQVQTHEDNHTLTDMQCRLVITSGVLNGLLDAVEPRPPLKSP